jgi:SAM-dependent methyltransferase
MYRGQTKGQTNPSQFLSTRSWMEVRARYFLDQMNDQIGNQHLDFGCGEGSFVKMLHDHLPNVQIHVIEPDPIYRSFAASHCDGREWIDLSELGDSGIMIDSISAIHVLEHVIDPVSVLVGMRSILSPGGRVLIDVPDATRYESLSDLHVSHCTHFCAETLTAALNKAGFTVLKCEPHDPPHLPKSIWVEATPSEVVESIDYEAAVSIDSRQLSRAGIERANQSLLSYTLKRIVKG